MIGIIHSRLSSSRFPEKALFDYNGRLVIQRVVDQIRLCKNIDKIIVATSTEPSDDKLATFCMDSGISFHRGSLCNLSSRIVEVLSKNYFTDFVRICGDSPFISHKLVDFGIDIFNKQKCDLVTNVFPRSFPIGQTVEVISGKVFAKEQSNINDEHSENITQYFYKNQENFKIVNFKNNKDESKVNWAIDYPDDIKIINERIKKTGIWEADKENFDVIKYKC